MSSSARVAAANANPAISYLMSFFSVTTKLKHSGFTSALFEPGAETDMRNFSVEKEKSLTFKYVVPPHLCRTVRGNRANVGGDGKGGEALPLSVLLAVFDDVSSWPVIAFDKKHRPGVSINLYAEFLQGSSGAFPVIRGGDTLNITATINKLGGQIGFIDLKAYDHDNKLIAIGRHTKFLNVMGRAYEILFGPLFWTVTPIIANLFGEGMKTRGGGADVDYAVYENSEHLNSILPVTSDGTFVVNDSSLNPMGSLHGGAQAIVAELFSALDHDGNHRPLRSLEVTYISSGGRTGNKLNLTCENSQHNSGAKVVKIWKKGRKGSDVIVSDCILHEQ